MNAAPVNPQALSRLYLQAVLPCFVDLVAQDPAARRIVEGWNAVFVLRIAQGPAASLRFRKGTVSYEPGRAAGATVDLLFLSDGHLNAFFSGKGWAIPVVVWGLWNVGKLAGFSKLAERLQKVLEGEASVLAEPVGRRLFTRLTLITAGLGLKPLADFDGPARKELAKIPRGLGSFTIDGEPNATVWFENGPGGASSAGWGEPARRPDVRIRFADVAVAYGALRDEIDTLAALGLGQIVVDGLVPLADGLNAVMERLRPYLEPKSLSQNDRIPR